MMEMESGPSARTPLALGAAGAAVSVQCSYETPGPICSRAVSEALSAGQPAGAGNVSSARAVADTEIAIAAASALQSNDRVVHGMSADSAKEPVMPHRSHISGVLALACALVSCAAAAMSAPADGPVRLALHLTPNAHFTFARTAVHVVSYDMNHTLLSLLGSRAAPTTLRRFGGTNPKDKSVVTRHDRYDGAMTGSGVRTPAVERLSDAGDGALDELPATALRVGQTWTFSRPVNLDRSLAEGTMTYTDTLTGLTVRNGHQIAAIAVSGAGVAQPASDLQAKGFHPSTYALHGSAEFDVTTGLPGSQHYDAQVEWVAHVMFSKIGLKFADTYDSSGWTVAVAHP